MKALDRDAHVLQGVARLLFNQVSLYAHAAAIADGPELRKELGEAQLERSRLLDEVHAKIALAGAERPDHGTAIGAVQKMLLNIHSYAEEDDRAAILEVERGEDFLRDQITKRLAQDELTPHTHNFLRVVLSRLTPIHDEMAHLKHAGAGAHTPLRPA